MIVRVRSSNATASTIVAQTGSRRARANPTTIQPTSATELITLSPLYPSAMVDSR
jgi:hypothetical protein